MSMDRFVGRVAVVTGASSGIGAQIAQDLANGGMKVVGIARRVHRVQDLADKLRDADAPGKLYALGADLTSESDVRRAYRWIDDNLGAIAVVVNNAALLKMIPPQDMFPGEISAIVNTNVSAVMVSCAEAISNMTKHNVTDGHIFNINSVGGHIMLHSQSVSMGIYCATKHALTAFHTGLRRDLGNLKGFRIRCTSISPGAVGTEMIAAEVAKLLERREAILSPSDISNALMYALTSPPRVEIVELTITSTGEAM